MKNYVSLYEFQYWHRTNLAIKNVIILQNNNKQLEIFFFRVQNLFSQKSSSCQNCCWPSQFWLWRSVRFPDQDSSNVKVESLYETKLNCNSSKSIAILYLLGVVHKSRQCFKFGVIKDFVTKVLQSVTMGEGVSKIIKKLSDVICRWPLSIIVNLFVDICN